MSKSTIKTKFFNKMFYPVPETESQSVRKVRKRVNKKQKKRTEQRIAKQKYEKGITSAMSSWAENFTVAATWQLKHQLAYWKAKAISLQYENSILHEVIQRNRIVVPTTSKKNRIVSDSEFGYSAAEHSGITTEDFETQEDDTDNTESESENDDNQNENEGEDFEVSEEFIQFLTANAKYKEDARRERERLRAKLEEESQVQLSGIQESVEDKIAQKKELYGDKYQKIVALEMYQMCNLKNEADKLKATYWPNIPLNLNSS